MKRQQSIPEEQHLSSERKKMDKIISEMKAGNETSFIELLKRERKANKKPDS